MPGPVRRARQAVKTGSIKARRVSDTTLRYGRRELTPHATTANAAKPDAFAATVRELAQQAA
ncbi:hypothetical protein [Streptomyces hygroscopicus]|uniref:hypothetical protein n=1 Tax=Streptomyces hygroscopicus TaxID=1912 RepID=UPI00224038BF|nr:hypothetical protein [Streptomyces hygroscopicus]